MKAMTSSLQAQVKIPSHLSIVKKNTKSAKCLILRYLTTGKPQLYSAVLLGSEILAYCCTKPHLTQPW